MELNDGVLPEPRDRMIRLASLPRDLGEPLRDAIEATGVPVVMLRGDGHVAPDGTRDVDLLVPRTAAGWVHDRFGPRLAELEREAAAARGAAASGTGRAPVEPEPA